MKLLVFLFHNSSPQLTEATHAAATITPQIFVRCWWKLQHALVPGKKPCCYQKESSLGFLVSVVVHLWWVHQSTPSFAGRYFARLWFNTSASVMCCFDFKTFSNLEKCFTDSSMERGVLPKVMFFFGLLRSYFCFHPEVIPSCVTFKMLWNQWQGVEFQLQASQAFSWVEKKYNELVIPTLPLFIFGFSVLWGHPSENMFGCSII